MLWEGVCDQGNRQQPWVQLVPCLENRHRQFVHHVLLRVEGGCDGTATWMWLSLLKTMWQVYRWSPQSSGISQPNWLQKVGRYSVKIRWTALQPTTPQSTQPRIANGQPKYPKACCTITKHGNRTQLHVEFPAVSHVICYNRLFHAVPSATAIGSLVLCRTAHALWNL